jgi:periplasmic protein TonB
MRPKCARISQCQVGQTLGLRRAPSPPNLSNVKRPALPRGRHPEPFLSPGVYPSMFEQSILTSAPAARKTGAVLASFSAQILAVGVIICVPLIYNDVLPRVKLTLPLARPVTSPPPVPTTQAPPDRSVTSGLHTSASAARIFAIPARNTASASAGPISLDPEGAPALTAKDGAAPSLPFAVPLPPPEKRPPVADPPKPSPPPLTVGGDVQAAKIIKRVIPVYPRAAIQTRVSGTVRLTGVIAKDGTVQKLQVVSGHPFLVQAALDAVRQWVYRPTFLNGQPVEVIAPIDIIFSLQ